MLSAPRSDGNTYMYKWPWIFKLDIPGIVHLPAAAIKSMSIQKPGQAGIWTARGRFIDISIDLQIDPLYNVEMLVDPDTEVKDTSLLLTVNDDIKKFVASLNLKI